MHMEPEGGSPMSGEQVPRIAYIMSRFPKLTETFVLYEMQAIEAQGGRIDPYPLQLERGPKMHREAQRWLERGRPESVLSWSIVWANLRGLARRPFRYASTLLLLLWHTRGSARYLAGGLAFFPKAVRFADRMLAEGVDHVHAHFASHPAAVAWVIHRLSGIPYSFTAHGSDLHRDRWMLRQKVSDAAFVVAISRFNRDVILEECGPAAAGKVVVIHCGVDLQVFQPNGAPNHRSAGPPRILCIGTLHEVKGQRYLLHACRRLVERGIPFACHLIGDGPDRPDLIREVNRMGIGDRVRFLGNLTQVEVRQELRQAALVAAPSVPTRNGRREGIPVALMEAMASGVPVVASRISGIPELVEDAESGVLVEPRDVEGLSGALERLLRDEGLRHRMGAAGRAKVEREFDLRQSAALLLSRYGGGTRR